MRCSRVLSLHRSEGPGDRGSAQASSGTAIRDRNAPLYAAEHALIARTWPVRGWGHDDGRPQPGLSVKPRDDAQWQRLRQVLGRFSGVYACANGAALILISTCAGDPHDLDLAVVLSPIDPSSERM